MDDPLSAVERIAHRGASRECPENTLPAFERAIERGAHAIELDVHSSADGVVVVRHDPTLPVPANGWRHDTVQTAADNEALVIKALPWSSLRTVEVAPGVTAPSLQQVIDLVRGRVKLYVEIKQSGIEDMVIQTIRRSGLSLPTACAVHSFDHAMIARTARLAPELPRGILFDEYPADVRSAMQAAGATDVWPQWELIDDRLVSDVHALGGRLIAWTVNDARAARTLAARRVDALCSDDVRQLG